VLPSPVRPLRAAVRALFETRIDGECPDPEALEVVNRVLRTPKRGAELAFRRGQFVLGSSGISTSREVLEAVATDTTRLLTGADVSLLQRCANERCILLFVDRSRRAARRWCSMEVCGNRAKVRAHYRRERER
jgi:predicted RNA-binding Zn ribbon-like protein